jgi:hypothetical protein
MRACREYLDEHGFVAFDAPILTPAACEGTTTLFPVEYFGETAYLTQSGQLYNEANAMALGRVYCFGPTFRAEKSKTRRHLTEFWMVEPEVAYADLNDVMELAEDLVVSVVGRVLEKRRRELTVIERDTSKLEAVQKPFPRISYDEAVKRLQAKGLPIQWGGDFGGPDETTLSEEYDRPLLVHRYPAAIKAFYMKPDPERAELALGVDVLAPEGYGEIIGGGERLGRDQISLRREHASCLLVVFIPHADAVGHIQARALAQILQAVDDLARKSLQAQLLGDREIEDHRQAALLRGPVTLQSGDLDGQVIASQDDLLIVDHDVRVSADDERIERRRLERLDGLRHPRHTLAEFLTEHWEIGGRGHAHVRGHVIHRDELRLIAEHLRLTTSSSNGVVSAWAPRLVNPPSPT